MGRWGAEIASWVDGMEADTAFGCPRPSACPSWLPFPCPTCAMRGGMSAGTPGREEGGFRPITLAPRSPALGRHLEIRMFTIRRRAPLLLRSSSLAKKPSGMLGEAWESQSSTIDTPKHAPVRVFQHATPERRQRKVDVAFNEPGLDAIDWQGKHSRASDIFSGQ